MKHFLLAMLCAISAVAFSQQDHAATKKEVHIDDKCTLYPDPSEGIFHINTHLDIYRATLISEDGKVIQELEPTNKGVYIEVHKHGTYVISLETEKGIITKRLVVD